MRLLLLAAAVLLAACSPSVTLNVHNGTDAPVRIEGLSDPLTVAPGETARVDGLRSIPELTAFDGDQTLETATIPSPPANGEAVWVVGGGACFAEADYGSYYSAADLPAGVVVVGSMKADERVYVSQGRIHAGPGQMLPKRARGAVHALIQVPCQANMRGDALLRSWLEIELLKIQPSE